MDRDIDRSGDGEFTIALLYALTGQMDSRKRGRAHGVHCQTWSMKIAEIGDPISYRGGITSQSDRLPLDLCLHTKELVFFIHHSYKDAYVAARPATLVHAVAPCGSVIAPGIVPGASVACIF